VKNKGRVKKNRTLGLQHSWLPRIVQETVLYLYKTQYTKDLHVQLNMNRDSSVSTVSWVRAGQSRNGG